MKYLKTKLIGAGVIAMLMASCGADKGAQMTVSGLNPADFDSTINGKKTELVTLKNNNGMEVCITNYGGRIVSISVPDKNGKPTDVVLSYDNIRQHADTLEYASNFGATVGRYANRIKNSKLVVDGKTYSLTPNNNGNCLHGGGNTGWQQQVYDVQAKTDSSVVLALTAPDGENGFPGTVKATATYTLKSNNTLDVVYEATTDKETVVNMTNHSYFNLNGDPSKDGENMVLYINADSFTPTDTLAIPTGEIRSVDGTPMDFRKAHALSEHINDTSYEQIKNAGGYDHNWVLNTYKNGKGDDTTVAASLYSPVTGILLELYTNEPGLQVYTGNFLGTGVACKHGIKYPKHASVCMETQKFPDSPTKIVNKTPGWEYSNPYLKPGQKYYSHFAYKFSVR